ncbi:MAG TPA: hypothetical protein VLZ74_00830 [Methylocella sp.]|nr:hypothetical protein [Methylocella sp.]
MTKMKSDVVVHQAIEALLDGRGTVVAGWFNSTIALSTRFAPRSMVINIAERLMRN